MSTDRITTFTAQGRAFILDRRPIPHSTMLWRVQATDGQAWFGVWHKGMTALGLFDAPQSIILRDTPQECFREFVRQRGVKLRPVLPELAWVERGERRMKELYGENHETNST